jgi:type IV secretion system protein VirB10
MKRMIKLSTIGALLSCLALHADQEGLPESTTATAAEAQTNAAGVTVPAGTRIPLVMINSVSSKHSQPGDPVYLESVYPVVVGGRILIPAGTYVSGSVIFSKRPGRVKGRGQLHVRVDQMILPNGVIRQLSGRPGALDGRAPDNFDRESGTVTSPGTKGEDAEDIARTTTTGASIGTIAGAVGGRTGAGLAIGSAAGAAAGLTKVLLSRGPDAMLERGTHIEMLLEQDLRFTEEEVQFRDPSARPRGTYGAGPDSNRNRRNRSGPRGTGRFPL